MARNTSNSTDGHQLARNVLWNLLGNGAPLLVALVAIPLLITGLGIARFGVLTLVWMVVGYFSLFDLGLGRAITKLIAEKLGTENEGEVPRLMWTAMSLMAALGVFGGLLVAMITPWLIVSVLEVPSELESETLVAFYLLATSVPIVIVTTGLRGFLEAGQYFGYVNLVRIPLGLVTFLGPLAVLPFSNSLVPVVAVLIVARIIALAVFGALCLFVRPALREEFSFDRHTAKTLVKFGGWMTVTNIVSPVMVYMDRFLIGASVSMVAVAFYATPYEIVTKLLILPGALMGVLFPAFSASLANDRDRAGRLFRRANNYIFIALFPAVLIIVTFASEGLALWLGKEFAENSAPVLQFLAVGVFINSLARAPFGLVQAAGRPDLTAKLHMVELVLYLPVLWLLLDAYGIVGAAVAWAARTAVDALLLYIMSDILLSGVSRLALRGTIMATVAISMFGAGAALSSLVSKGIYLTVVIGIFSAVAWCRILGADERSVVLNRLTGQYQGNRT